LRLSCVGTNPIAVGAPFQGLSGSTISLWGIPASSRRRRTSSSPLMPGTARTMAYVPSGGVSTTLSPAACVTCDARNPLGRSERTMM